MHLARVLRNIFYLVDGILTINIYLVALDNFEMSTYRLSSDCSSSELQGKILAREPGFEPGTTESKSVVFPTTLFPNKTWRTARDSNPEPLVLETRTLPIELAIH